MNGFEVTLTAHREMIDTTTWADLIDDKKVYEPGVIETSGEAIGPTVALERLYSADGVSDLAFLDARLRGQAVFFEMEWLSRRMVAMGDLSRVRLRVNGFVFIVENGFLMSGEVILRPGKPPQFRDTVFSPTNPEARP